MGMGLTFDAGLPLATAAKHTHLFHLKFFDTQFFTAGHANPKAPAGGTGIITLAQGYHLATVRTITPCRHFQDLQASPFCQTTAHHRLKTKGQGLDLHPRQWADLQPDAGNATKALPGDFRLDDLEDTFTEGHLMHEECLNLEPALTKRIDGCDGGGGGAIPPGPIPGFGVSVQTPVP